MKLQPPTTGRATNLHISEQPRLPRAPSNLALNTSRDGRGSTASLGSCSSTSPLSVQNFPLTPNLHLPSLDFQPFPLVLLLSPLSKS